MLAAGGGALAITCTSIVRMAARGASGLHLCSDAIIHTRAALQQLWRSSVPLLLPLDFKSCQALHACVTGNSNVINIITAHQPLHATMQNDGVLMKINITIVQVSVTWVCD
jgi:hypothetical protein